MKIILGRQYIENDNFAHLLLECFGKQNIGIEVTMRYNRRGILNFLEKDSSADVIILQEYMEPAFPISVDFINSLEEKYPRLSIVLILSDDRKKDKKLLQRFYKNKIYNILFEKDATVEQIFELILNPRNPMGAKTYMDIGQDIMQLGNENEKPIVSEHQLTSIINSLYNVSDQDELFEVYEYIVSQHNEVENIYIISKIPSDIAEFLQTNLKFVKYKKMLESMEFAGFLVKEGSQETGKQIQEPIKGKPESKIITKTIVQDRIIGTVVIGVGGAMYNSGTTHTTMGIASYLDKLKQKVAVLEFNDSPCMKNLLNIATFSNEDYLIANDIDVYFQKNSKADLKEFNQQLSKAKSRDYKYIIIDLGALKKFNAQGIIEPTPGYHEIWRTDHQILCLNGSVWKWPDIYYYRHDDYAELEGNIGLWKLLVNLSTDQNFKYIKKETKGTTVINNIFLSPVYIDPFIVDKSTNAVFYELFKEILPVNLIGKEKTNFNPLSIFKKV